MPVDSCEHCGNDLQGGQGRHTPNCSSINAPCINNGCTNPRSNASSECFECRFAPYGTEWQLEQQERGLYP